MLFELQIQIRVGKAAGTPMLEGHDIALARLRLEFAADLAAPRAVSEGLSQPRCLLDGRNVVPGLIVAWAVSMMQRIEDAKPRLPRGIQDPQHIRNTIIRLCNRLQAIPYLASLGNEIVIRIDLKKCSDLLVICHIRRASSNLRGHP